MLVVNTVREAASYGRLTDALSICNELAILPLAQAHPPQQLLQQQNNMIAMNLHQSKRRHHYIDTLDIREEAYPVLANVPRLQHELCVHLSALNTSQGDNGMHPPVHGNICLPAVQKRCGRWLTLSPAALALGIPASASNQAGGHVWCECSRAWSHRTSLVYLSATVTKC